MRLVAIADHACDSQSHGKWRSRAFSQSSNNAKTAQTKKRSEAIEKQWIDKQYVKVELCLWNRWNSCPNGRWNPIFYYPKNGKRCHPYLDIKAENKAIHGLKNNVTPLDGSKSA